MLTVMTDLPVLFLASLTISSCELYKTVLGGLRLWVIQDLWERGSAWTSVQGPWISCCCFCVFSKGNRLAHKYSTDIIYDDFVVEMQHLPLVHKTKFGKAELKLLELLNILTDYKLYEIFLNVCASLIILLTIPATVASAEKSFSKLKLIKNCLSTMSQTRLLT